ncbi:hypothetical protein BS50DRAFT_416402 [Corynespora cassiicola Philippines]|uniref:Uncharacterized protein n=1 Tax=Corynespora cassiicola Philippines TaxID=1448308 RepID=A0A2T2NM60_CORCC|nr:hypothetical protein BS50DRAFT_416402 [Corynespora cassiicola Philippines]
MHVVYGPWPCTSVSPRPMYLRRRLKYRYVNAAGGPFTSAACVDSSRFDWYLLLERSAGDAYNSCTYMTIHQASSASSPIKSLELLCRRTFLSSPKKKIRAATKSHSAERCFPNCPFEPQRRNGLMACRNRLRGASASRPLRTSNWGRNSVMRVSGDNNNRPLSVSI